MIKKIVNISLVLSIVCVLVGCNSTNTIKSNKLQVVATTTMLYDLASVIGEGVIDVTGLMGEGVDPHLFKASAKDVTLIEQADVILYNGLHLEGQMSEVFDSISDKEIICIEDGLDENYLLQSDDLYGSYDPHIWFDVLLWKDAAMYVANYLMDIDEINKDIYLNNLNDYLIELDVLNEEMVTSLNEVETKVLITAHDAFNYFGNAYGFEVLGLQGISTDSEASTNDISTLATYISENKIKAIFVESSVSSKSIEALQAAVKAKGFEVSIGGSLFSDSLGSAPYNSYIETVKYNINTIVEALK